MLRPANRRGSHILLLMLPFLATLWGCESSESRFEGHMQRAAQQLELGSPELASVEIRNALRLNDASAEAHFLHAQIDEQQQKYSSMLRHLERTIAIDPQHLEAQIKLAWVYTIKGDLQSASAAAMAANNLASDSPRTLVALANVRLRQGEFIEARELANSALAQDSTHADAFAVLAATAQEEGNYSEAVDVLNRGIELNPENLTLRVLLLESSRLNGTVDETENQLTRLTAEFPAQLTFSRELADIHLARGDTAGAERVLSQAQERNPTSTDAVLMYAELLAARSPTQAADILREFLPKAGEDSRLIQLRLADVYRADGSSGLAHTLYTEVAGGPDDTLALAAHRQLAALALTGGDPDLAQSELAAALAIDPINRDTLLDQAHLQHSIGDLNGAQLSAQRLVASHPDSLEGVLLLGSLYAQRDSRALARSQFQKALHIEPGNGVASLALAELYQSDNDLSGAERILTNARRSNPNESAIVRKLLEVRVARGDWSGAVQLMNGPLTDQVAPTAQHFVEGQLSRSEGLLAESNRQFSAALEIDPEFAAAITGLMENARLGGSPEDAMSILEGVVQRHPNSQRPYLALAGLYLEAGDAAKAGQTVDELTGRHPAWLPGEQARTRLLLSTGDLAGAALSAERALASHPDDIPSLMALANIASSRGQPQDAIGYYKRILKLDGDQIIARNNLASLLIRTSNRAEDIAEAADLVENFRNTDSAALRHTLGWIDVVRNRPNQGVTLLLQALEQLPGNVEITCHLAIGRRLADETSQPSDEIRRLCGDLLTGDVSVARLLDRIAATEASDGNPAA